MTTIKKLATITYVNSYTILIFMGEIIICADYELTHEYENCIAAIMHLIIILIKAQGLSTFIQATDTHPQQHRASGVATRLIHLCAD